MNNSLPQPGTFLDTKQICDLQVKLGMVADSIIRQIEEYQNKIDATKHEIANRWKQVREIDAADRRRLSERETAAHIREIMDEVVGKLNANFARAKELYTQIDNARAFYPGKLQFLMNATVMSETRARYATTLALAGPMELAGYAAYAIGVQDHIMAAAVVQANDALPAKERRFASASVSERIEIPAWNALQSALKLANVLYQQVEVAVRTFKAGKSNPIDTIRLAMLKNDLIADKKD